jgi:hypothetical protein
MLSLPKKEFERFRKLGRNICMYIYIFYVCMYSFVNKLKFLWAVQKKYKKIHENDYFSTFVVFFTYATQKVRFLNEFVSM